MSVDKRIPSLLIQIQSRRSTLTSAEVRVADYILDHPEDVLQCSVSELAANSGTSDATVIRAIRRLGLPGFNEMKVQLAQSMVAPVKILNSEIDEGDSVDDVIQKVFGGIINTLTVTRDSVSTEQLEAAADLLFDAGNIYLVGLGNSASSVSDFQQKLLRLGRRVTVQFDPHLLLIDIVNYAGPGDVCFAISHSGHSKLVVDAVSLCRERGCKVISLTDNAASPLRDLADISLCTMSSETRYNQYASASKIAQYAICNVLYTIMSYKHEALALKNFTDVETNMQLYKC